MDSQKPPLIPAFTVLSGSYTHTSRSGIDWEYVYDIHAAGTRSESRTGRLSAQGIDLASARPGALVRTPWGTMLRASDTPNERAWLLEHTFGQPIDTTHGAHVHVPEGALTREGRWTAAVGAWTYILHAEALGSRSERRIGRLHYHRVAIAGEKPGDHVDTPWGRMYWLGTYDEATPARYEQGFLLHGTADRALDDMQGDAILPGEAPHRVMLESLYLAALKLDEDGLIAHRVTLTLSNRPDHATELQGHLLLDPNACSLNAFGDTENCTRIAVREVKVTLDLQRLADPKGLGRHYFRVHGEGIPANTALVVHRRMERCFLHVNRQLVPLYLDDGV